MIGWFHQLRIAFGASFLWLVCLIYFTQGFRSFVWTAVSYQLKDNLKLSPSASQFVSSIAFFPWSIKPLYGILSDCIPIKGRKRIPYLFLATLLSLFPWITLGVSSSLRNSRLQLMILLTFQNLGSAMADVVIDAMIAEAVRLERKFLFVISTWPTFWFGFRRLHLEACRVRTLFTLYLICLIVIQELEYPNQSRQNDTDLMTGDILFSFFLFLSILQGLIYITFPLNRASFAGDLQSISWMAMALGGIFGSLLGGYALTTLQIDKIFLLFSVLPTIQLFSCGLVEEKSVEPELSTSNDSHIANGNGSHEDSVYANGKTGSLRRKKSQKKTKKAPSYLPEKKRSLASRWFLSLKMATYALFRAFRQPKIIRPMAWFFLAHVTVPNLSTVMFYYQSEVLKLDASFLGTVRVVGWLGLMFGTFTYNRYLKKMKLRRILMWAHVGLVFSGILDVLLVSRTNISLGISDKVMVLGGSALADGINQFKFMPFLILSGQLCPPGIEGTLFALFMSINNFGATVGNFVGAGLASILSISSGSFDNITLGISIQVLCTVIPVLFLFMIPKEATGISA